MIKPINSCRYEQQRKSAVRQGFIS